MRLTANQITVLDLVAEGRPYWGAQHRNALIGRNNTLDSLRRLGLVQYRKVRNLFHPIITEAGERERKKGLTY